MESWDPAHTTPCVPISTTMAQAPIGLLISSLLRDNRRRSFSVDRIPSPELAIRESSIASRLRSPPVLVGAIADWNQISKIKWSRIPLPGVHTSSALTFDETRKWPVRINHPLAAIYILIHPNRSQRSPTHSSRHTGGRLYLHAGRTRRPSNQSRRRHSQRIYRLLLS